jgi:hypothetical protein
LEPSIAEPMLHAGELPNLARVAAQGGYSRVQTTCPAQTPVAWSTFATGVNPGAHGIFDFVRRNPATYLPELGLNRYEQKNAFVPPRVVNLRRGRALWEVLAADGIASTCLRCPCTYPPDATRGKMLAGLGVPDLRGGFGTATFYTATAGTVSQEGEQAIPIPSDSDKPVTTYLPGPLDLKTRSPHRRELTIEPKPASRQAVIRVQGSSEPMTIEEKQWSPWLRVRFKLGMFQSVAGLIRFYLVRLTPTIELYASPINFDPEEPLFPISFPAEYASELADEIGMYYTAGMAEDHSGLNNGRFSEAAFLEQCATLWQNCERNASTGPLREPIPRTLVCLTIQFGKRLAHHCAALEFETRRGLDNCRSMILAGEDRMVDKKMRMVRKAEVGLLESNPPRNSRLETHRRR